MSNPQNRLSGFRSYSYRHVLVMCDSTTTADLLMSSNDEGTWQHASDTSPELGRYAPRAALGDENAKYCVLIDGATDAAFTISKATWSAATAAAATNQDRYTSVAVEGSISISEPKGVVFLDTMVNCCKALLIDAQTAVFVLKTFFVGFGYDPDQGEYVENISDVPPIQFLTYDMTGSFTEQGGVYELMFVAMSGGATRLPQYSRIPGTVNMTAAPTLGGTLKKLEKTIAELYKPFFECVKAQVYASVKDAGKDPTPVVNALRQVTYKISYNERFETYTCTDQSSTAKSQADCSAPVNLSSLSNVSIEDIIHRIMSSSSEVKRDMSTGDPNDKSMKYEYKIHAILETLKTGPVVTYHVDRFMRPKEMMKTLGFEDFANFDKGTTSDPIMNPVLRKSIIQFDYIYTGKNIDILEFEMKVNTGMAYLQIASATGTYKGQLDGAPNKTTVVDTNSQTMLTRMGELVPIPVFFGSQIQSNTFKNSLNSIDSAQAAYTLAKHSSIEVSEATMKIVGNLNFLGAIGNYTSPGYHTDRITNKAAAADTAKAEPLSTFGTSPAFASVRVKMPRNNDDISLFQGQAGEGENADYATDFWFDGYYYIYGIENVFDGGEFYQTLMMLGIPQTGIIESTTKDTKQQEVNFNKRVAECFGSQVGCGQPGADATSSSPKAVAAPVVKDGVSTEKGPSPATKADSDSANNTLKSPSEVKGWDKAKPAVKDSITNAAASTGTNATTLAQMAAIESGFGRATHNPKSSAAGTFQIVRKTWNGVVNSGQVPGVPPGTSFAEANDPEKNAAVAAVLMHQNQQQIRKVSGATTANEVSAGDTYLAHFLGAGGAGAVIKADRSSSGSTTVKDAYIARFGNTKEFERAKVSNPGIVTDNTTVGELRAKAAASMATSTPLASVKVAGTTHAVAAPTPTATTAPAETAKQVSGGDNLSRHRDCKNEEEKKTTQNSCDQSKPEPDKNNPTAASSAETGAYG